MEYKTLVTISDEFRNILKKQQYEKLILVFLNKSTKLINNLPLNHIEEQSHGEPDYVDAKGNKYDVKLILEKEQGALIGDRKNESEKWIESMLDETSEYSACIEKQDLTIVKDTKLYKIMKKRLNSVKEDEIAILFIPFYIVLEPRDSVIAQFASDFLQAVFDELVANKEVKCKDVYFIYPCSQNGYYVLRNANTKVREYLMFPEMKEYIEYRVVIYK